MAVLGIDVGGTGIKGAPVDLETGELKSERLYLYTPKPATPEAVASTIAELVEKFEWKGPVGCGFPAVVQKGKVLTASNIDQSWLGANAQNLLEEKTGCPCRIANDADSAGLAEIRYGAGKGRDGVVLVVTFGTGIGSALFCHGRLVPNTELGQITIDGRIAEKWAAASIRTAEDLSWKEWAARVDVYLKAVYLYLWPDLIIVGGGVSQDHAEFLPLLTVDCEVIPATLRNEAGIVGGALAAESLITD